MRGFFRISEAVWVRSWHYKGHRIKTVMVAVLGRERLAFSVSFCFWVFNVLGGGFKWEWSVVMWLPLGRRLFGGIG